MQHGFAVSIREFSASTSTRHVRHGVTASCSDDPLDYLDQGGSYITLVGAAVRYAGGTTNEKAVDILWESLFNAPPTAAQAQPFVDGIAHNVYSLDLLASFVADSQILADNIGLVGLSSNGVNYTLAG